MVDWPDAWHRAQSREGNPSPPSPAPTFPNTRPGPWKTQGVFHLRFRTVVTCRLHGMTLNSLEDVTMKLPIITTAGDQTDPNSSCTAPVKKREVFLQVQVGTQRHQDWSGLEHRGSAGVALTCHGRLRGGLALSCLRGLLENRKPRKSDVPVLGRVSLMTTGTWERSNCCPFGRSARSGCRLVDATVAHSTGVPPVTAGLTASGCGAWGPAATTCP